MVNFNAVTALGLLGLATQVSAAPTPDASTSVTYKPFVKVMPFGASIMSGCWRAQLYKKLGQAQQINFDMVGSQQGGDCGLFYDVDHEGHPGFLATDIVKNNQLPGWLAAAKPDVVLVHLGTNDAIQNKSTTDVIAAYSTLIDQMRASKPTMNIIFSTLIPISPTKFPGLDVPQHIQNYNAAIKTWAPKKSTSASPITVVDNYDGFDVDKDTAEGEHPNDSGNLKLATKFFGPTRDAIKAIGGPWPPTKA